MEVLKALDTLEIEIGNLHNAVDVVEFEIFHSFIYLFIYLFVCLFASDTYNLDHMYPYQLLVAVTKKKGK